MTSGDNPAAGRIAPLMERWREMRARNRQEPVPLPDSAVAPEADAAPPDASVAVSWPLRVGAAWAWRTIVVLVLAAGLFWCMGQVMSVVVAVAVALLLTVLLQPVVDWLERLGMPRWAAAAIGLVLTLVLVVVLLSRAAVSMYAQFPALLDKASAGMDKAVEWAASTLPVDAATVDNLATKIAGEVGGYLSANASKLASGALSVTASVGSIVTGLLIALFCLFFFLKEGRRIWLWLVRLFPASAREPLHEASIRGWVTLSGYTRTQILVAAIDAAGIGLGAFFLGIPMALPITILVFFGAFIPIVGAFASGAIAVLVALMDQGPVTALIMLVIILVVQQLEGNVLQPWLMSSAVSLHPVAVLLAVAVGGLTIGIAGALFAVPVTAFLNAFLLYLHGYDTVPTMQVKADRPGGPPGMTHALIARSYGRSVPITERAYATIAVGQDPATAPAAEGAEPPDDEDAASPEGDTAPVES